MKEAAQDWYYVTKGEQTGPVSIEEIQNLIATGTISAETRVWNGKGEWQAAQAMEHLTHLFILEKPNTPPPLNGDDIDNRYIWAIVAVPIVGSIIELIAGTELLWLYIAANIICCVLDEKKLKAAGHETPVKWMVFLVPVYLWKRAELLRHKKHYFWGWIATFILSILIGLGGNQAIIEDTACPIVTDIIANQLRGSAECEAVRITEEVSDDFYKAVAILDNGRELNITIKKRKNGEIYVQISR